MVVVGVDGQHGHGIGDRSTVLHAVVFAAFDEPESANQLPAPCVPGLDDYANWGRRVVPAELGEHGGTEVHAVTAADPLRIHADAEVDHGAIRIEARHSCLGSDAEEPDEAVRVGIGYCRVSIGGTWQFIVIGSAEIVDLPRTRVLPIGYLPGVAAGEGTYYQAVGPSIVHSETLSYSSAIAEAIFRQGVTQPAEYWSGAW